MHFPFPEPLFTLRNKGSTADSRLKGRLSCGRDNLRMPADIDIAFTVPGSFL